MNPIENNSINKQQQSSEQSRCEDVLDELANRIFSGDTFWVSCLDKILTNSVILKNQDAAKINEIENLRHFGHALVLFKDSNLRDIASECFQIESQYMRHQVLKHFEKKAGKEKSEELRNLLPIDQDKINKIILKYMHLRGRPMKKIGGLCFGFCLLHMYYFFLGKPDEFYRRLQRVISIDVSQWKSLSSKKYEDLTKDQKEFEHLVNDLLYLQAEFLERNQAFPLEVLKIVTDKDDIKKLDYQEQCTGYFSSVELTNFLENVGKANPAAKKYLLIGGEAHIVSVSFEGKNAYFYDSNNCFRKVINVDSGMKDLARRIICSLRAEDQALYIYVISQEKLQITPPKLTKSFINRKTQKGPTPLYMAARARNKGLVSSLIDAGADVNALGNYGHTPLMSAVSEGHLDVVKLLIEKGADINKKVKGATALTIAARKGHLDIVSLLIEKEADFEPNNKFGNTPIWYAYRFNHKKVYNDLKQRGAKISRLKKIFYKIRLFLKRFLPIEL